MTKLYDIHRSSQQQLFAFTYLKSTRALANSSFPHDWNRYKSVTFYGHESTRSLHTVTRLYSCLISMTQWVTFVVLNGKRGIKMENRFFLHAWKRYKSVTFYGHESLHTDTKLYTSFTFIANSKFLSFWNKYNSFKVNMDQFITMKILFIYAWWSRNKISHGYLNNVESYDLPYAYFKNTLNQPLLIYDCQLKSQQHFISCCCFLITFLPGMYIFHCLQNQRSTKASYF